MHTIKPLDKELVLEYAKKTGAIATCEEHNVVGGLGAAVAECTAEECPVPVLKIGVQDVFGKSGNGNELLDKFGLTAPFIVEKAKAAIAKK